MTPSLLTLDFYCDKLKLAVELDGSQHADSTRDRVRDARLAEAGIEVIRYWNHDVLARTESVLEDLYTRLQARAELVDGERGPSARSTKRSSNAWSRSTPSAPPKKRADSCANCVRNSRTRPRKPCRNTQRCKPMPTKPPQRNLPSPSNRYRGRRKPSIKSAPSPTSSPPVRNRSASTTSPRALPRVVRGRNVCHHCWRCSSRWGARVKRVVDTAGFHKKLRAASRILGKSQV